MKFELQSRVAENIPNMQEINYFKFYVRTNLTLNLLRAPVPLLARHDDVNLLQYQVTRNVLTLLATLVQYRCQNQIARTLQSKYFS